MIKRRQQGSTFLNILGVLLALMLFFIGVSLVDLIPWKLDFTEEKVHTLSKGTLNIVEGLEDEVSLTFYRSQSIDSLHPNLKDFAKRVAVLLEDYNKLSDMITLKVIDPVPYSEEEEDAVVNNMHPYETPDGNFFCGLSVSGLSEDIQTIPIFDPNRESMIEYQITQAISRASQEYKAKVGILSSMPVFGTQPDPSKMMPGMPRPQATPPFYFVQRLAQENFEIEEIKTEDKSIPEDIDLIIVYKVDTLSKDLHFAIDQHIVKGKNALFFVDPQLYRQPNRPQAPDAPSIDDLINKLGVKYDANMVVGDEIFATLTQFRTPGPRRPHPCELNIEKDKSKGVFNQKEIVTQNLKKIQMVDAGSLELAEGSDHLSFVPLIKSSVKANLLDKNAFAGPQPNAMGMTPPSKNKKHFDALEMMVETQKASGQYTLAALVQGSFKSSYDKAPEGSSIVFQKENTNAKGTIIVTADAEIITDHFSVQKSPLPFLPPVEHNDNQSYLVNCVDFMLGDKNLITLRTRGTQKRPFDIVDNLEAEAQKRHSKRKLELEAKVNAANQKLSQLLQDPNARKNEKMISEQLNETIKQVRSEVADGNRELRKVVKEEREEIEALGSKVYWANIMSLPLIVTLFGIFFGIKRYTRMRS